MVESQGTRRSWNRRAALIVIVAAVVVGAAVSFALYPRGAASPQAPVTGGPVRVAAIQAPPRDVPLMWFRDASAGAPYVLRAVQWSGRTVGSLSVSCDACGVLASPDGHRLLIGSQSTPGYSPAADRVFDSSGRQLSKVDGFQAQWADDSRHLCTLRAPNPEATALSTTADVVVTDTVSGHARHVARVVTPSARNLGVWTLLSCMVSADRAALEFAGNTVRSLRVVRLSTGAALLSEDYAAGDAGCPCPYSSAVVSAGAGTLAENLAQSGDIREIDERSGTTLTSSSSWRGRGPVLYLSWDGRLAVTPLGVYSFPEGAAIWRAQLPAYLVPSGSNPAGGSVLISLWTGSATNGVPLIVHADGSTMELSPALLSQPPLPF